MPSIPTLHSTQHARLEASRTQYREYHSLTQRVQEELNGIAEELIDQEGWERDVREGVREWVGDAGVCWRALRRARFDASKAQSLLLSSLTNRIRLDLHTSIPPIPPYTFPTSERSQPLFAFLPYPHHQDAFGRPLAVLTLRQVKRDFSRTEDDEDAKVKARVAGTEGLMEVAWWIAEQGRRVVRDLDVQSGRGRRRNKGKGTEGGVGITEGEEVVKGYALIVDVQGAGLSNLQLELLPHLINIHHHHFPGLVTSIFIVNQTWTSQALWTCLKRVLPTAALDKIVWLDNSSSRGKEEMSGLFEMMTLPRALGGQGDFDLAQDGDIMLERYSVPAAAGQLSDALPLRRSSSDVGRLTAVESPSPHLFSRSNSVESIADVYYTAARNSPAISRPQTPAIISSRAMMSKRARSSQNLPGLSMKDLQMTRSDAVALSSNALGLVSDKLKVREAGLGIIIPTDEEVRSGLKRPHSPSATATKEDLSPQTPMQRIKSLTDFRLYLSPSRRANIELLLGSDDEDEQEKTPTAKKQHHPLVIARRPQIAPLSQRRLSALRVNPEGARSYSASLTRHHARGLEEKVVSSPSPPPEPIIVQAQEWAEPRDAIAPSPSPPLVPVPVVTTTIVAAAAATTTTTVNHLSHSIPTYAPTNPMFGYPVISLANDGHLQPRYGRKRKRDLIKALLYLFLLRLSSLREWVDVFLGSLGLVSTRPSTGYYRVENPETAFTRWTREYVSKDDPLERTRGGRSSTSKTMERREVGGGGGGGGAGVGERNFIWMVFTLLIIRGGVPLGWEKTVGRVWEGWVKVKSAVGG